MALKIGRETAEILVGALALAAFALFVGFAFTVNQHAVSGYSLYGIYRHVDGLALHADVRLQVSSGAHPRYARNTGSGEPLATAATRSRPRAWRPRTRPASP